MTAGERDGRPDVAALADAVRSGIAEERWDSRTKEATARLLAARRFDVLADAVSKAPPGSGVGELLRRALVAPRTLRRLLAEQENAGPTVERVLEWAEPDAAEVVVEVLAEADPPDPGPLVRALERMGPHAERPIAERWADFPAPVREALFETVVESDAIAEKTRPVRALAEDLLDALAEEESRSERREIFDRLVGLGARVTTLIPPRLDDRRWSVRRNLLGLLAEIGTVPRGFSALEYLEDRSEDPRVRLEALKVTLLGRRERREALRIGLEDPDERVLRLALAGLEEPDAERLTRLVLRRARDPNLSATTRAAAIRALAPAETLEVRDFLIDLAGDLRPMRGFRLAEKSPVSLAALSVLAARWSDDPVVRRVLEKARGSEDREIRRTVAAARRAGPPGAVG